MVVNDVYLVHFGILGQKWGIRRYQNLDGTLTELGRNRLKENINDSNKSIQYDLNRKESIKYYGINKIDEENDKINKGTIFYRLANSDEKLNEKRKYVSVTDNDRYDYWEMIDMLGLDFYKPASEFVFEANKDLKVASGKQVVNDLINKYGSKRLKEFQEIYEYTDMAYSLNVTKDKKLEKYKEQNEEEIKSIIDKYFDKNVDKISKEYMDKGYDAIVDVKDRVIAEYPLILLNPGKDVTLKKKNSVDNYEY